jgi:hypothetical protein
MGRGMFFRSIINAVVEMKADDGGRGGGGNM